MFRLLRQAIWSLFRSRREPEGTNDDEDRSFMSEEDIWDEINTAWSRMSFEQRRLWEMVKIIPEKWSFEQKTPHGTWVVAILGRMTIRYDDTDWGGFSLSLWTKYGFIEADVSSDGTLEDKLRVMASYFNTSLSGPPGE